MQLLLPIKKLVITAAKPMTSVAKCY